MNHLDTATITIITNELNELTKNPIGGWNTTYPNLYNALQSIIHDLAIKLNCPMPLLFIDFHGVQSYQASAHLMTNGSAQLHIGTDFIKKFLLNPSLEGIKQRYNAFRWAIAHELGHVCDPSFKLYGNLYPLRTLSNNVVTFLLFFLITMSLWGTLPVYAAFLTPLRLLAFGSIFFLLRKIGLILLFRSFEYNADKITMNIQDSYTPDDAHYALEEMSSSISSFFKQQYPNPQNIVLKIIGICYEKYMLIKYFNGHPPIKNRIARMKK